MAWLSSTRRIAEGSLLGPSASLCSQTPAVEKCLLLTLPPELRNTIYELVLPQREDIPIIWFLRVPALLQVCRQIRNETLEMWHCGNTFTFVVQHCDADLLMRFYKHLATVGLQHVVEFQVEVKGKLNWTNLIRWCMAICALGNPRVRSAAGGSTVKVKSGITAAVGLALECHERDRGWEECLAAFGWLRFGLGAHDSRWKM
ncbi:hypothetical protein LTR56_004355 [Elasticomyces elasticus]|nr:hypothetical protein LTR22_012083 [Elasticomyces elasticus]KAK3653943.1 hypothetical protein LTR56_004355 [Elasticomyces elasticus]KAK4917169.1 hypothetical protein LTR49_014934 [Elasticomyces elasticus]KAK5757101.1 hypothetical protein LTS12_012775 [Elasticomyces elasticus]